ncbi:MAG: hypothetical protein AB1894_13095 [Chloroflexota bacterium]
MRNYGKTTLYEYLGDKVVYRNLEPWDAELPGLRQLATALGLPQGVIPRKNENDYARLMVKLLEAAQARRTGAALRQLVYVGDTRLLDGTAFDNLCQASRWPGLAFIAAENGDPLKIEIELHAQGGQVFLANRWAALEEFAGYVGDHGLPVDESTVVIVDIDKTALGGRGRNGHVIDRARLQAVQDTVAALLGPAFEPEAFRSAYDRLNRAEFHPFTTDNQDYLAYICLILGSGLYELEDLLKAIRTETMKSFHDFIAEVERQRAALPAQLAEIHADIFAHVQAGDPTPFKAFRRGEYLRTIGCFGQLEDSAPVQRLLDEEILITQEVRQAVLAWREAGALLFGLSDKPDEAATPTPELAAQGYQPIHRAETHALGAG